MSSIEFDQDEIPQPARLYVPLIVAMFAILLLQMSMTYLSVLQLEEQTRLMEQKAASGLAKAIADKDLSDMLVDFEAAGFENARIAQSASNDTISVEIISKQGLRRGFIAFTPEAPSQKVFQKTAPYKISLIAASMFVVAWVLLKLRRQTQIIDAKRKHARTMALTDGLSGVANRTYFNVRLDAELTKLAAGGSNIALYFIDIDNFKRTNDTHGHAAGDALIVNLAQNLLQLTDKDHLVARLAGDEFAIVRPGAGDADASMAFGNMLVKAIDRDFSLGNARVKMSISVGVVIAEKFERVERTILCHNADMALYAAKRAGRNQAQLFSKETKAAHETRKSA